MFSLAVAQAGATVITLYLSGHFAKAWADNVNFGPRAMSRAKRIRLIVLGDVVALVLFSAVVAVVWS